jgi:gluconokinase
MVGVGDRGTRKGVTTEAIESSSQIVVTSARADIAGVRTILVVMGVSGSGKTTIAKALADRLGWAFEEGDDLHPGSDITRMRSGHPLDDRDRWPWLEKVAEWIDGWRQAGKSGVITCSGPQAQLSRFSRARATGRAPPLFARRCRLIAARLTARKGRFIPAGLLDSQLATLEEPDPDEQPIFADVGRRDHGRGDDRSGRRVRPAGLHHPCAVVGGRRHDGGQRIRSATGVDPQHSDGVGPQDYRSRF